MRLPVFLLLVLLLAGACSSEPAPPYQLPPNAAYLLSGDSVKSWKLASRYNGGVRVNMGPCYMGHVKTFRASGTFSDNNGEQSADCGESMHGLWYLRHDHKQNPYLSLKSELIPLVFGTEADIKDFQIVAIQQDSLVVRFRHALFSSKTTLIEDTFVPEELEIPGRNFHW
jgi:hypothetical protein